MGWTLPTESTSRQLIGSDRDPNQSTTRDLGHTTVDYLTQIISSWTPIGTRDA